MVLEPPAITETANGFWCEESSAYGNTMQFSILFIIRYCPEDSLARLPCAQVTKRTTLTRSEMFTRHHRLFGFLLPTALVTVHLFASPAAAQKRKETVVFVPASLSLSSDTTVVSVCAEGNLPGPQVRLNARASSSGDYQPRYHWSTSSGRITGDGPVVTWDLSGLRPGYYKAFVEVETGGNNDECRAFTSTSVLVNPCPPVQPVCPKVSIICPDNVVLDQPLVFSSNVSSVSSGVAPLYNWTVSAGRITEGQGTSSIKVDTTGLAGQTVRATLSMGGYTLDCSDSCSVQIPLPHLRPRKFDEFPNIARNDEKARLDNFGVELQNDPTASAYVIVYPGRSGKPGDVQKHTTRIVDYLVNTRGIDARRIVTVVGGTRDELMMELWLSPQGATPPRP